MSGGNGHDPGTKQMVEVMLRMEDIPSLRLHAGRRTPSIAAASPWRSSGRGALLSVIVASLAVFALHVFVEKPALRIRERLAA